MRLRAGNPVRTGSVEAKHSERSAPVFVPLTAASSLLCFSHLPSSPRPSSPPAPSPPALHSLASVSPRPAGVSQSAEAEQRGDEHPERHQDGKHKAAVVGCVRVRCSGARLDPGLGTRWDLFLATFLAPFAVLLFFLLFLVFLQAGVRLEFRHVC